MYKTRISLAAFFLFTISTPVFSMDSGYILATGEDAVERLAHQHKKLNSAQQVKEAGLQAGNRVADLGCGTGEMLPELAEIVGKTGFVIAVDNNEAQLNIAKQKVSGANNISFLYHDASSLRPEDLNGLVDVAHVRLLVSHMPTLQVPEFMKAIWGVLKIGGMVVCLDVDKSTSYEPCEGTTCTPDQKKFITAYQNLAKLVGGARGVDYTIGARLSEPFKKQGFSIVKNEPNKPVINGIELYEHFLAESKEWGDKVIKGGFLKQDELEEWKRITSTMSEDQKFFLAIYTCVEARKEND